MKSILIDPVKQQLIPFQLSFTKKLKHSYDVLDCERVDMVPLPGNLLLLADDDGMLKATGGILSSKANQGYFVLLDNNGAACNLIAGRGIVVAEDEDGRTSALPDYITPASLSKFIRFVPPERNAEAAKICEELLADSGFVMAPENYHRIPAKYLNSMNRAITLCRK